MKSKQRLLSIANSVVLPLVIISCAFFVWKRWDLFVAATNISLLGFFFTTLIGFALLIIGGLKFKSMLPFFPLTLTFKEWFGLTTITTFYGKILPARMGTIPRAWYLKKHHKVKYTSYISILSGSNILDLIINSILGIILLFFFSKNEFTLSNIILGGFVISLCCGCLGTLAIVAAQHFKLRTGIHKIDNLGDTALLALAAFGKNPTQLFNLILVSVVLILVQSLSLGSCLYVIGGPIPVAILIVAVCAVNLSTVISITPGNIGISEGVIVAALSLANVPLELSVSASILFRATALPPQILLGLIYTYLLFGKVFNATSAQSLQEDCT